MDNWTKYGVWVLVVLVALYLLWQNQRYEGCISGYMKATGMTRDLVKMYC